MTETVPCVSIFRRSLCCVLSVTIGVVGATSDFHNNNNNHDNAQHSPYLYSEIQSLDFHDYDVDTSSSTPVADETTRNPLDNRQRQNQQASYTSSPFDFDLSSVSDVDTESFDDPAASASIVASSVLYDGDCYVSSEAMMCHGGGGDMMDRFINNYDGLFEDDEEASDEDDDDDDDNDGHSSMLSNASLQRSKSVTRGDNAQCYASGRKRSALSNTEHTTYTNKVVKLDNNMLQLHHRQRNNIHQQQDIQQQPQQQLHHTFLFQQRPETVAFLRDRVRTSATATTSKPTEQR